MPSPTTYADDPQAVPWGLSSVKLYSRDANSNGVTQQYVF
jgi:hypothetical protein